MFEVFEHTADVGLRIRADDLPGLFTEAAAGLTSLIVENPEAIRPAQRRTFYLESARRDDLLFDWLNELLYSFEVQRMLFSRFDVRVTDGSFDATAEGEPLDPSRHRLSHEVKAVTYHQFKVEQVSDGWLAEVIFDI